MWRGGSVRKGERGAVSTTLTFPFQDGLGPPPPFYSNHLNSGPRLWFCLHRRRPPHISFFLITSNGHSFDPIIFISALKYHGPGQIFISCVFLSRGLSSVPVVDISTTGQLLQFPCISPGPQNPADLGNYQLKEDKSDTRKEP